MAAHPERLLAAVVLSLVCFGLVMVFSSSSTTALLNDGDPLGLAVRQTLYALVGLGAYAVFVRMDPGTMRRIAPAAVAIAGFLLLVVLVPSIGTMVNGSRRWISLGGLGAIQPSEIAKLALALWIAQAVIRRPERLSTPRGLVPFLGVTGAFALLILIEPDLETALIACAMAFVMLLVAGARARHLGVLVGGAALLALVAVMAEPYRRARLMTFIDPWSDPEGAGFQAVQAQVALGTGGLHGVGLGDGVQKAFYLPEAHTDMILATIGEELGLIGVLAVLIAYGLFAVAGYRIALGARTLHQQVLAAGLTTTVVIQAAVNIGAVVGALPVSGVPLPFVSFGGSNLITFLACTGILVNIGRRSHAPASRLAVVEGAGGDRRRRDGRARDAGAGGGRRAARAGG
ncbi:putative lipid II flippase FtsW [Miltoncostaea marina]|uniref:putative lipid II flippase FtsW n=1 Tax=Miltoncostaea marina TaxID=2843215 RepID=UPI001C3DA6B0|nr:putative lipid II flippase FtsW [Miltoncostaea marina]